MYINPGARKRGYNVRVPVVYLLRCVPFSTFLRGTNQVNEELNWEEGINKGGCFCVGYVEVRKAQE